MAAGDAPDAHEVAGAKVRDPSGVEGHHLTETLVSVAQVRLRETCSHRACALGAASLPGSVCKCRDRMRAARRRTCRPICTDVRRAHAPQWRPFDSRGPIARAWSVRPLPHSHEELCGGSRGETPAIAGNWRPHN